MAYKDLALEIFNVENIVHLSAILLTFSQKFSWNPRDIAAILTFGGSFLQLLPLLQLYVVSFVKIYLQKRK